PGFELGILTNRRDRREFAEAYKRKSAEAGPATRPVEIEPRYENSLGKRIGIVVAGTAGERVQFASYFLVQAVVLSGAKATQKNDNPVTQGTGFSLSEVVLSPDEICYTGIDTPDIVVVVSEDGVRELKAKGTLESAGRETLIIADDSL
ncbi:MAG TPA: hypothetical protein PL001_12395, partial [Candidatus Kryptobacter bacterium]|nr:hypothetical protein [Candidatus Kryptobacter bacterium]